MMRTMLARAWRAAREAGRDDVPRPHDLPRAHAAGPDADRILLLGSGPAVGWGVTTHDLALPGAMARQLSRRTGRGATVDLIADPDMDAVAAVAVLRGARLARYDAVVVSVGVNEALRLDSSASWRRAVAGLVDAIAAECPRGMPVVLAGIPPIRSIRLFDAPMGNLAARRAVRLETVTARESARRARTVHVPLPARTDGDPLRHRGADDFAAWASLLADALVPELDGADRVRERLGRSDPAAEERRQSAVDVLLGPDAAPVDPAQEVLARILRVARDIFEAPTAAVSIIDRDTQVTLLRVGDGVDELPRAWSFCDVTIRSDGPLVVDDALLDPRFVDLPVPAGTEPLRFYAGFPLVSPDGERVGALCVTDTRPHDTSDGAELALLGDLAMRAQRELWAAWSAGDPPGIDEAR